VAVVEDCGLLRMSVVVIMAVLGAVIMVVIVLGVVIMFVIEVVFEVMVVAEAMVVMVMLVRGITVVIRLLVPLRYGRRVLGNDWKRRSAIAVSVAILLCDRRGIVVLRLIVMWYGAEFKTKIVVRVIICRYEQFLFVVSIGRLQ
jgi:hypothetical protein